MSKNFKTFQQKNLIYRVHDICLLSLLMKMFTFLVITDSGLISYNMSRANIIHNDSHILFILIYKYVYVNFLTRVLLKDNLNELCGAHSLQLFH